MAFCLLVISATPDLRARPSFSSTASRGEGAAVLLEHSMPLTFDHDPISFYRDSTTLACVAPMPKRRPGLARRLLFKYPPGGNLKLPADSGASVPLKRTGPPPPPSENQLPSNSIESQMINVKEIIFQPAPKTPPGKSQDSSARRCWPFLRSPARPAATLSAARL